MSSRKRARPQPFSAPVDPSRRWSTNLLAAAALIALALLFYWPALGARFVWDDRMYLTQGSLMSAPLWRLWFGPDAIDYLPLTFTLYRLQWSVWDANATAFHAVNILLHGGAALALWRVLRRLEVPGAWLAAALFAVHPVAVESVAWIAEEKNTLSLLLAAAALLLYLEAEDRPPRYWLAVVVYALALFAKPAVIMLPVVLLLLAWWKQGRIASLDWLRSAPFFALSGVFAVVTILYQQRSIGVEQVPLGGPGERLAQAVNAAWFYISKLFLPRDLMFFYPPWQHRGLDWKILAGVAGLLAVTALLWQRRARWGRGPLTALACYLALLLPVLGLLDMAWLQFAPVADHYQYPAMIALLALAASAVAKLPVREARWAVAAAMITALGAITFAQAATFKDEDTLWRATLARNPQAWAAYTGLAQTATERGDDSAAIAWLQRAAELNPRYAAIHNNLGAAYQRSGDGERAMEEYSAAARINPHLAQPQFNLGLLLLQRRRPAEAEPYLARALELMPGSSLAETKLGRALLQQEKLEPAALHLERATRLDPASFEAHALLAECLRRQGKLQEAYAEEQRAAALRGR